MKFIFLIAAFNAVFFTVLLLQKRPKALHDKILIFWLLFLGLYIGVYAFYSHDLFTHFHLLSISLISLLMLLGPFLYYYILALVDDKRSVKRADLLHLAPFFLFNLYILAASFSPDLSEKLNIEMVGPGKNPPLLFLFFLIVTVISGTVYFLLTVNLFKKLDIQIFNHFSNSPDLNLSWIRRLVVVFGVVWTVLISITVIHHVFQLFSMLFCTDGLFLALSVFVLLIGYFGLKQKIIYSHEVPAPSQDNILAQTRYSGSNLSDSEAKQLAQQLKMHMETSKSYLNPDLALAELAIETDMSSHILSQVINEQFKLNFFDFINRYRVEECKTRMVDPGFSHLSLLGIALDCGFNSKSAFNRIFKKATGLTPTQYKGTVN